MWSVVDLSWELVSSDAETDLGAAALGPAFQVGCRQVGKGLTRMPAVTPRTPGPGTSNFRFVAGTLVPNSVLRHHWSMRLQGRQDIPTGS